MDDMQLGDLRRMGLSLYLVAELDLQTIGDDIIFGWVVVRKDAGIKLLSLTMLSQDKLLSRAEKRCLAVASKLAICDFLARLAAYIWWCRLMISTS